ncbi:MAG TPA: single-stranded DNA-binding protein [Longimicrobiales bacterium]|nr:single-stranded DNA-binding protein [Longimicrobiales bacterium]
MSRSLNKVMLIGNVGADPEIRVTNSGVKVAKVSLATNRTWTDRSGQQQERTEWHRLNFWDRLADVVEQYVHKGDRLYAEGRIEYSQTEDDKGTVKYFTDIRVFEMVMLGSQTGGGGGGSMDESSQRRPRQPPAGGAGGAGSGGGSPFDADDDDLPF